MSTDSMDLLKVEGICKRFAQSIPAKRKQLIRQFSKALRGETDGSEVLAPGEFWALKDVSFSLKRGEALGLIGMNGAGKSTLLSIVARQILPDRGEVRSRGQIAAMINLTAGFEDTLTGRENVLLKGALLGRSRKQMLKQFDEIIAFAEIGDFIDSPVATYSSGMCMRLAFSISIHAEQDLLLIDEVLSVGDFRFRQKCLRKLNKLREHASFIFVSHSFQDIARFCDRLIVLNQGRLAFDGTTTEGIRFYADGGAEVNAAKYASSDSQSPDLAGAPISLMGEFIHQEDLIDSVSFFWISDDGKQVCAVKQGEVIIAALKFRLRVVDDGVIVGLPLWDSRGMVITSVNSDVSRCNITPDALGFVSLQIRFNSMDLNPGIYFPVVSIVRNSENLFRNAVEPLTVSDTHAMTWGVFTPQTVWTSVKMRE